MSNVDFGSLNGDIFFDFMSMEELDNFEDYYRRYLKYTNVDVNEKTGEFYTGKS